MTKLTTPTGLFIAGKWLQPGDAVPDRVPGYDYAKAARKGLIEHQDGAEITNPSAETSDATSEDGAHVTDLERANHGLKAELERLTENAEQELARIKGQVEARDAEHEALKGKAAELDQELRLVRIELDARDTQHGDALRQADALRAELQQELDQTRAALEQLQSAPAPAALPADARDRLIALNGINEKRADEILAALTRVD